MVLVGKGCVAGSQQGVCKGCNRAALGHLEVWAVCYGERGSPGRVCAALGTRSGGSQSAGTEGQEGPAWAGSLEGEIIQGWM